ncbi:MAG: carbohydrate porin [Candidatus Omnitrophota bacterium]|jgi:carbohydrate-selective porin OprB|nr:carbohydrate porin [Candidatus Omnitrophota bacterium]
MFYAVLSLIFILFFTLPCAQANLTPIEISETKETIPSSDEWLNNLSKYREGVVEEYGTEFAFLFNFTQQAILRDASNQGKSRGVGYFNLEIKQRLWRNAAVFMEVESDRGMGIDKFIPTYSVFNSNYGKDVDIYIPEFYLEQNLFSDKISLSFGKLDLSDWFDANTAAESADTQFLSSALVNNLAIPFPSKGLGGLVGFMPYEWLYFQSGAATARASSTKTGLSNGYNSTFFINELGLSPKTGELKGNYRVIFYLNHEKIERIDEEGEKKNTLGYAVSFDQEITKKITLFFRYGNADEKVWDIKHFWSFGGQILEPVPGRKLDYLGIGMACSIMGDDFRSINEETASRAETMYEIYYSYSLSPLINLTPSLQVVNHPNADKSAKTAVVLGLRFLLSF